ncbi:MAG: ribbon-helix-helix protein, CopG family [Silvibacterium sp.]|nr:ribbon-helix-helix protein, CopG family [Silvibacterium sp.]MBV8436818.1 ribbon-helix-helix protein, CopG family [Silvibacterium sp.]
MRTTQVLSITLPEPMLKEARDLAKQENRTMSELIREALRQYQRQKRWEAIAALGQSTARTANVHDEEDVVDAIHRFRREQHKAKSMRPAKARKTA